MELQKIINTASKYPWRYGHNSWSKCPLTKTCDIRESAADKYVLAASICNVPVTHITTFVSWWDATLSRDHVQAAEEATRLEHYGYNIPAGPRLIRARRKTKRVRAYQYLRSL